MAKRKRRKKKKNIIKKVTYLILVLICVILYARFFGTKGLEVKKYDINIEGIPKSFDGFKIVHFSDMDLGSTFYIDNVDNVVKKINKLEPDIVVFTGDMFLTVDKKSVERLKQELIKIDPLISKYLVRGDKDVKNVFFDEIVNESGFIDITNDSKLIYYKGNIPIAIYGLDSITKGKPDYVKLALNRDSSFKILLTHEPDVLKNLKPDHMDLVLSGHSHNNEINIPFVKKVLSIKGATKYYDETYKKGGTTLFVQSGLGTEKTYMRLFNKPSINVYTLIS